jgi:DNA replication protein DnaC
MKPLKENLKKIAGGMSRENMATTSNTDLPGDPNCPICHGIGFVSRDLPTSHPEFGRLVVCSCRQQDLLRQEQQRLFRMSNLDAFQKMTFETFKTQGRMGLGDQQVKSLQYALNQAQHFAGRLEGWLFFSGTYGCGKTHLAAAIANFVVNLNVPTLFLTVPDLLDWLRFSFESSDSSLEERLDEIRTIRLLVLDDLGTQNATPWSQEKLYQVINHRYIHRLPLVVTSNQLLGDIDPRIASRLQDPDLVTRVEISAPDFRSPMQDEDHSGISSLGLLRERTFGSFSLREHENLAPQDQQTLRKAFDAANSFAENPAGWLVFMGGYATGKTHLAAAIGNYRKAMGGEPIFVVVPDLLDHLRATFSPSSSISYDRRFEEVRSAPLLILDDLGTQSATPWAREKLYQLLNYRYNAQLPTVITTAQTLEEIDPRIRSRMLDKRICAVFGITAPGYLPTSTGSTRRRPHKRNA